MVRTLMVDLGAHFTISRLALRTTALTLSVRRTCITSQLWTFMTAPCCCSPVILIPARLVDPKTASQCRMGGSCRTSPSGRWWWTRCARSQICRWTCIWCAAEAMSDSSQSSVATKLMCSREEECCLCTALDWPWRSELPGNDSAALAVLGKSIPSPMLLSMIARRIDRSADGRSASRRSIVEQRGEGMGFRRTAAATGSMFSSAPPVHRASAAVLFWECPLSLLHCPGTPLHRRI